MTESGPYAGWPPSGAPGDPRGDAAGPHAPYPPAAFATPQTSTSAIVALVLATVSWVAVPLIPAVVALILARNAREEVAASGGRVTGEGLARAARTTAWANIVFSGVVLLAVLLVFTVLGVFT